jgi:hypothetical protein
LKGTLVSFEFVQDGQRESAPQAQERRPQAQQRQPVKNFDDDMDLPF